MASAKRPVELSIAGKSYRVVSSTDPANLKRLSHIVEEKLQELGTGQTSHPQAFLLVALSLAHELDAERTYNRQLREGGVSAIQDMLQRVDEALEYVDENGVPLSNESAGSLR